MILLNNVHKHSRITNNMPQINNSPITCIDHKNFRDLSPENKALAVYLETIQRTIPRENKSFCVPTELTEKPFGQGAAIADLCDIMGWRSFSPYEGYTVVIICNPLCDNERGSTL